MYKIDRRKGVQKSFLRTDPNSGTGKIFAQLTY